MITGLDSHPQKTLQQWCTSGYCLSLFNPVTHVTASIVPHSTASATPPHIVQKHVCYNFTHKPIYSKYPGGIFRLLHVSHRLGCCWVVYTERRMEPTTASCFSPLERIHPPICHSCYSFPSAADNALSWSSSAVLLLHSHFFQPWFSTIKKKEDTIFGE